MAAGAVDSDSEAGAGGQAAAAADPGRGRHPGRPAAAMPGPAAARSP